MWHLSVHSVKLLPKTSRASETAQASRKEETPFRSKLLDAIIPSRNAPRHSFLEIIENIDGRARGDSLDVE